MTEQEFYECFGKPEPMLVWWDEDYSYRSVASKRNSKFDVVELSSGYYWLNIKARSGWTGWTATYIEADGSYEAADSVYNLKESEFVLILIDEPEMNPDW